MSAAAPRRLALFGLACGQPGASRDEASPAPVMTTLAGWGERATAQKQTGPATWPAPQ